MDPFTAFSLIETVFQFLDCGSRFIFLARSLYQTGSDPPETYDHLVKIAKDFETILPELKDAKSANDKDLAHLAVECSKTVMRLSSILQRVTATHSVRKRDAMKAAFRLMYKKDEISSLQDQLGSFRDQINLHLLISLRSAYFPRKEICSPC